MGLKELRAELDDEVSTLLGDDFDIEITNTLSVPNADDAAITFPDLTEGRQGTKLIDTCVLYIDIRRSTELNFSHKAPTVARLYTAFVRAMTRVARHYRGHVRGIIGDRVMVIFDTEKCFTNAVNCAVAMNTVAQYIINRRFKKNEVSCGIGIDAGKMLVTKAGIRRHGVEQGNYRNLVWLGRPANIASKLTDLANKGPSTEEVPVASVLYEEPAPPVSPIAEALAHYAGPYASGLAALPGPTASEALGLGAIFGTLGPTPTNSLAAVNVWEPQPKPKTELKWKTESLQQLLSRVEVKYGPFRLEHQDPKFRSFIVMTETRTSRVATKPILMTASVWKGFRSEQPDDPIIKNGWIRRVQVKTPGYDGAVFGGDVIFKPLKE